MKDSVLIFEGAAAHDIHDGLAQVVELPVSASGTAPHPVYSLDGLLALALAVSRLEGSE